MQDVVTTYGRMPVLMWLTNDLTIHRTIPSHPRVWMFSSHMDSLLVEHLYGHVSLTKHRWSSFQHMAMYTHGPTTPHNRCGVRLCSYVRQATLLIIMAILVYRVVIGNYNLWCLVDVGYGQQTSLQWHYYNRRSKAVL